MQEELPQEAITKEQEEEKSSSFSFFIPQKYFFVTPVIIYLNILVFAWMALSGVSIMNPQIPDVIDWGANFRHSLVEGENWRLFTSQFVHIGILHLAFNLYALFYIGFLLEPVIGSINFLVFYLFSGLMGSINSVIWHDFTASAGASGAIFGMYGLYLVLLLLHKAERPNQKQLRVSLLTFIGFNVLFGITPDSGIDNAGHFGGLLGGIISGVVFFLLGKWNQNEKTIASVGMVLMIATWFIGKSMLAQLPDPLGKVETTLKYVADLETKILDKLNAADETNQKVFMDLLDECATSWDVAKEKLMELDEFKLPPHLEERLIYLEQYAENRSRFLRIYRKKLKENSVDYDFELERLNTKKDELLQKLQ